MPDKSPSFLLRLYPAAFLALVICGPVLLLPHSLTVFMFVATLDAVFGLALMALVGLLYLLHAVVPEKLQEEMASCAATIAGQNRVQKTAQFMQRCFRFCSMALLIVNAHYVFGTFAFISHVALTLYLRLMVKIHAARK